MPYENYRELAMKTLSALNPLNKDADKRLINSNILHGVVGVITEINELKNYTDSTNFIEEVGDILWYLALLETIRKSKFSNTVFLTPMITDELLYKELTVEDLRKPEGTHQFESTACEFLDYLKKGLFYGKELESFTISQYIVSLHEHFKSFILSVYLSKPKLFDNLFEDYTVDKLNNALDKYIEKAMKLNIEKLKARYGDAFDTEKSENRDLEKERNILSGIED